jgi:TonB family protein
MKAISILIIIILSGSARVFAKEIKYNESCIHQVFADTIPAKNDSSYLDENGELKVFDKVDIEAEFPGGLSGWKDFVINNLDPGVPANKGAPVGQYTVVVRFIVDKDGSVTGIKALTNYGYGMEAEVIRMIKRSPKWTPAQQGGRFVKAYRQQPVTFVVQEEKKKKRTKG